MPYCLPLAILQLLEECAMPKLELTLIGLNASMNKQPIRGGKQSSMGCRHAILGMQLPNHRLGKLDTLSQHAKHNQPIPACSQPIRGQGSWTCYPSMQ